MELKELIAHAKQVAENPDCDAHDCAYQHDKLVDYLEELQKYKEAEAEWRAAIFPVKIGDIVSLVRKGHVEVCAVKGFSSKALGCWEVKLYPLIQDWLGNPKSVTYRVRLSQFNKSWFKDSEKARQATTEKVYGQAQDAVDLHNRNSMQKIATFLEQSAEKDVPHEFLGGTKR